MSTIILPSHDGAAPLTTTLFDRDDLAETGQKIKQDALLAILSTRGVDMEEEAFNSLVIEALMLNNHIVRAQMMEHIADDLVNDRLTMKMIDSAIDYFVKQVDGTAAKLGRMVELVEECKTPGPRH